MCGMLKWSKERPAHSEMSSQIPPQRPSEFAKGRVQSSGLTFEAQVHRPLEILYGDFYDFPRMFLVTDGSSRYLFDGSFDDEIDDYPSDYAVYLMPDLSRDDLAGSWATL